jgi:hypothetical protein
MHSKGGSLTVWTVVGHGTRAWVKEEEGCQKGNRLTSDEGLITRIYRKLKN